MEIEDLEEETYLYVRYRCDAGEYVPDKKLKINKDINNSIGLSIKKKKKKVTKNKVEINDKDLDSEDDEEDEADMDVNQNYYTEFKVWRMNNIQDFRIKPLAHEKKLCGDKIFENKHLLP